MKLSELKDCLTPNELAHKTDLQGQFVRDLLREGRISGFKFSGRWYVRKEIAQRFINEVQEFRKATRISLEDWRP